MHFFKLTLFIICTTDFPKYSEKYTVFLVEAQEYNRTYTAGEHILMVISSLIIGDNKPEKGRFVWGDAGVILHPF